MLTPFCLCSLNVIVRRLSPESLIAFTLIVQRGLPRRSICWSTQPTKQSSLTASVFTSLPGFTDTRHAAFRGNQNHDQQGKAAIYKYSSNIFHILATQSLCFLQMNSPPHLSRVRFANQRPSGDLANYASTNELCSSDGIRVFILKIFPEATSRLRKPNRDCDVSIRFYSFLTRNSESPLVAHVYSSTKPPTDYHPHVLSPYRTVYRRPYRR